MRKSLQVLIAATTLLASVTSIQVQAGAQPYIGEIRYFAGSFAPRGWAFCEGQLLQVSQFDALFSLLGTTYGGDGRTTFALPDMRGRIPIHVGQGAGLPNYRQGSQGGRENVTMTTANMPNHNHLVGANSGTGNANSPENAVFARVRRGHNPPPTADVSMNSVSNSGASQDISNIPPTQTARCIIALQGIFPSRN